MSLLAVVILRQQRQKEDLDAALRYVPSTLPPPAGTQLFPCGAEELTCSLRVCFLFHMDSPCSPPGVCGFSPASRSVS